MGPYGLHPWIYYAPEVRRGKYWCMVGTISVSILPSYPDMNPIALQLHEDEYSWVVKIRNTSEAVLRSQFSPWPSYCISYINTPIVRKSTKKVTGVSQ